MKIAPLPEQRRIVAKIEALQARCRAAREALDAVGPLLDKFRQSVLAAAFRGDLTADWRAKHPNVEPASALLERIRKERRRRWEADQLEKMQAKGKPPKDDRWKAKYEEPKPVETEGLPELPEGWCWANLGSVIRVRNGFAFKSQDFTTSGVAVVRQSNLAGDNVDLTRAVHLPQHFLKEFQRYRLDRGDILIGMSGSIGKLCVYNENEPALQNQRTGKIELPYGYPSIERYIWWVLNSIQAELLEKGKGAAVQNVSPEDIESLWFCLPPLDEQDAIVAKIEAMEAHARTLRDALDSIASRMPKHNMLQQLNQSILAKAFRGELVPQDPNDEPASVLLERIRTERAGSASKAPKRGRKAKAG